MSVEGISTISPPPSGTSRYLCCGSSILHRVFASSQMVVTYLSNLVVFPAVDLHDLLTAGGVAVTVGDVGRASGNVGSLRGGSGFGISWLIGTGSTCCCHVVFPAFSSTEGG